MYCAQPGRARDDLDTTIAALVVDQQARRLPPRYPPLIGMIPSPSILVEVQWRVMSADRTSIEAVLAFGGAVRLLPLRLPHADEDAIEMVLQALLPFDGLLFSGRSGDTASRLYSQVPHPPSDGWPRALVRSVDHAHGIGGPSDASSALGPVVEQSDYMEPLAETLRQDSGGPQADEVTAAGWKSYRTGSLACGQGFAPSGNSLAVTPMLGSFLQEGRNYHA